MANVTLFAQVIRLIPREIIQRLVKKHDTDKHAKGFNSWSYLVTMIFSRFSGSVSLRQISEGRQSATGNLNHLGLSRAPSKFNISYQNAPVSLQLNSIFETQHFHQNRPLSVDKWAVFTASRRARNSIGGIPPFLPQMSRGDWPAWQLSYTHPPPKTFRTLLETDGDLTTCNYSLLIYAKSERQVQSENHGII